MVSRFCLALLGLVLPVSASADSDGSSFSFSPMPRWSTEPENDAVCQAMKKECAQAWKKKQDEFQIGYELLYDAAGSVTGMRITQSSSCKPVDEYYQMFKRSMLFSPKLENIRVELAEGIKTDDVRIIRSDSTSFNFTCQR
jgi:hypothetical protein